jgi:hypothetical protein
VCRMSCWTRRCGSWRRDVALTMPDGAFAPSVTFSPDPWVSGNDRRQNKGSGRGECSIPLGKNVALTMPDGAFAPTVTFFPDPWDSGNDGRRNKRSGRGECPVPLGIADMLYILARRKPTQLFAMPAGRISRSAGRRVSGP